MTPIDPRRTEDLTCKGCVETVALGHNESLVPNACMPGVLQLWNRVPPMHVTIAPTEARKKYNCGAG